jgi:prepilin-type N-terminal cleavage/methylation domain-containing protein
MTARESHLRRPSGRSRGFTLVELLVVMLIVLLVSAVALPTVIPAISHRQVSEAARLLQASLVGARDAAIHANAPRGIRLLPDPAFFTVTTATDSNGNPLPPTLARLSNGQVDPSVILAANRIVPIESAPDYSEGKLDFFDPSGSTHVWTTPNGWPPPYPGPPGSSPNGLYPVPTPPSNPAAYNPNFISTYTGLPVQPKVLCVVQAAFDTTSTVLPSNAPTSWFWNIRLGDKIQIDNSGTYYTVVGPMTVTPAGITLNNTPYANPELFVNDGPPGSQPQLARAYANGVTASLEYLFLVNGIDDDGNGEADQGWDGVNNNWNFDANNKPIIDELDEWENEKWLGSHARGTGLNLAYTIRRRPVPSTGAREVDLPSNVVVDMTTWSATQQERSRVPVNPYTGYVDILLDSSGRVVPSTLYSTPSSFGLAAAFYHFWLAERGDVAAPLNLATSSGQNAPFHLPMLAGTQNSAGGDTYDAIRSLSVNAALGELKGERSLITLNTRTGQIVTNAVEAFDVGNVNLPFLAPQVGAQGGP